MPINGEHIRKRRPRTRGLELLKVVYAELYQEVGEDFSTAELMQAAQALIEISRDEYVDKLSDEYVARPEYHSEDVVNAMARRAWIILYNEQSCDDLVDDRRSLDFQGISNLRQILQGMVS